MDPLAPRFLSMDPAAVDGTASNFNRYAYAGNTPYRKFDPDGRDPVFVSSYAYQQSAVLEQINDRIESVGIDLGRQAVGFAPGGDMGLCAASGCGVGGWAMAVVGAIPGEGKVAQGLVKVAERVRAAATLAENAVKGAKAEAAVAAQLGERVAGQRVTLEATTGQRSVADFVTKDRGVVEVKSGNARLSSGQKAVQADIQAGRPVIPRGENAKKAGLDPGDPVPMKSYDVTRHQ